MTPFYFTDVYQAVTWATEVLRKQRFPKISPVYKELLLQNAEESRQTVTTWFGEAANLPQDSHDRYALAMEVYKHIGQLDEEQQLLIKVKFWGDYRTSDTLARALREQDILRRKGIRTRLNYRYSDRQTGIILGVDHKTVARRLEKTWEALEAALARGGLVLSQQSIADEDAIARTA
ncbi:MAG: hypothetical protein GC134_01850 [Proteobacteria bacterium]|nr:hypothetical protein [Pseudomonadota bacterium]